MMNALTYFTRSCPRKCKYCALRDGKGVGQQLSGAQWIKVFKIFKEMGVSFNLILGNETWLLGEELLTIFKENEVPYALYTTCPEPWWIKYREKFFDSGYIDNLSAGIDFPMLPHYHPMINDDSYKKSATALAGLRWFREHYPDFDCQGTVTVHKMNYEYLPELVKTLTDLGVFIGINFIHWDKDGKYDFFPKKEEIPELLFEREDLPKLRSVLDEVIAMDNLVQNIEMLKVPVADLTGMGWHCKGDPYGGPSVDADGTLRVCGYRKGEHTSKLKIWDLPKKRKEWEEAVWLDALACPGCFWSYPWMFAYWTEEDHEMGTKVFVKHAGRHIDKSKWKKRIRE